jgi:DNA-binding transcriptional LysR family regulator
MELRHLRYFVAVAEELHFRRAAERLHVAQPAVSEQVRKLEAELGVLLLNRTQRNVTLTVPGAAMLEEARRVLRQADAAVQAARSAGSRGLGRLRIGYMPDALPRYVPQSLARFAAAAPGIEVVLEAGSPLRLAADVRSGGLDVAVVCLPLASGALRVTPLGEEGAVIALPAAHPLAAAEAIEPTQIAQTRHVLLPRASNPAFFDGVISTWRAAGLTADPLEASEPQVEHVLLAVAAGAGFAILPSSAADRYSVSGVRFVRLARSLGCGIAILSRDEDSMNVERFLRVAQMTARAAQRPVARPARSAELHLTPGAAAEAGSTAPGLRGTQTTVSDRCTAAEREPCASTATAVTR